MGKTNETKTLERNIWKTTEKIGLFACFEVTIGFNNNEQGRVDYMTYETNGTWRCYEIKISKSDFKSKALHTFVGHYNYYVMTEELYEQVKDLIPDHIGVYINGQNCVKRPKRQELPVSEDILKDSLIRSLSRENEKIVKSGDITLYEKLRSSLSYYKRESKKWEDKFYKALKEKSNGHSIL